MPQLQPSRAAASLQQDMDKETSVGVCAQVSLPYCPESNVRTDIQKALHKVSVRQSDRRQAVDVLPLQTKCLISTEWQGEIWPALMPRAAGWCHPQPVRQ